MNILLSVQRAPSREVTQMIARAGQWTGHTLTTIETDLTTGHPKQVLSHFGIMVEPMDDPQPGDGLRWWTNRIDLGLEWWRLPHHLLPSRRTLSEVLVDAVQHGVQNPTHGENCACMDSIVWELRRHIDRALPPVHSWTEPDPDAPGDPTMRFDATEYAANMTARRRIAVVLHALARNI